MKDFKKLIGKEIRIKRYGYGKVMKIGKDTFTFKIPVDDMKWEKLELDLKFLKRAKLVKDSELDKKRFRISSITKNFYSKLLSWTGRTTRKEFFFGRLNSLLILLIPSGILGYFIMVNPPRKEFVFAAIALIVFGVLTFAGTISLTARRLQDLGYKGIYSLVFYTIILSLVSYGWLTLEEPMVFTLVMGSIYLIFEILLIFTISDFDNKFGPCSIARLDDEEDFEKKLTKKESKKNKTEEQEKKQEIKKDGAYTNLKEFTEKVKKDNEEKEAQKEREEKIKEAEKRLLEKQKIEKEKRKAEDKKRSESSESLKDLSERIRKETRSELEKNPDALRKLPDKKEEAPDNDFLAEMLAMEKLETKKLLNEYEDEFKKGEISKEEFDRLKKELEK